MSNVVTCAFQAFTKRMLQCGDWGFVVKVEAHFDESGTDSSQLTLAGYLFEAGRVGEFSDLWLAELDRLGLPYFHMVDCAHGAAPFDSLSRAQRVRLQMKMMRLIKRFSINGVVCNIENLKDNKSSSFEKVVRRALNKVVDWANQTAFSGDIGYFFESGDGQGTTNEWLSEIASHPSQQSHYRYAGHAFLPKRNNPGVQAADLLAWQYHNFTKKRAAANLARLDLRALLRHPHILEDECGELPRESHLQSVKESRNRISTVHYLPRVREEDTAGRSVIHLTKDNTGFVHDGSATVLACPNCYRAISEGFKGNVINIVVRCWCGTYCDIPAVFTPYQIEYRSLRF